MVQHYLNAWNKNTDVIQVKQQGDTLLVPWTLIYETTEVRACVGQTKQHVSKIIEA